MYTQKKDARYSYIGPFRKQVKKIAWEYLKQATENILLPGKPPLESDLSVRLFNGSEIALYGSDNVDALRGTYNDGVIIDEYGDCRPSLWGKVVLPTLADRKGWAVFIGTPKGHNHFEEIYRRAEKEPNWFHFMLKASESGILDEEELREQRSQMTEDEYAQEYECSFDAAITGAYYAKLLNELEARGQVTQVPYDPEHTVHVASDLGYTDSSSYWFWQERPDGFAVIDFEEHDNQPLSFYFDLLKSKGYKYETIWLPHDARAKTLQTGRSTIEQFLEAGFPVRIGPQMSVQHGIDAGRFILPQCYFDKVRCEEGLAALRNYHREYDEVHKMYVDKPMHDWSSHAADGFRYMALVCRQLRPVATPTKPAPLIITPTQYTLDMLFKEHDRKTRRLGSRI
jgi:hypothetical protein